MYHYLKKRLNEINNRLLADHNNVARIFDINKCDKINKISIVSGKQIS